MGGNNPHHPHDLMGSFFSYSGWRYLFAGGLVFLFGHHVLLVASHGLVLLITEFAVHIISM